MESPIQAAQDLVMSELVQEVRRAQDDLEKHLRLPSDQSVKPLIWDAKYHGRRMARLATCVQMLESLSKGF